MEMLRALLAAVAVAAVFDLAMGVNYNVGQPGGGWDLTTNYAQWVSGKNFRVNDTITFIYTSIHDVTEVNSAAYGACSASSPISKDATGRTVFQLAAAGKRYFICGVSTHCSQGMKVEIDVGAPNPAGSPPAPAGPPASPSPSGSPPAAPSPGSSTSSPPPPPSGAAGASLGMRGKLALGFVLGMMVALGL